MTVLQNILYDAKCSIILDVFKVRLVEHSLSIYLIELIDLTHKKHSLD